MWFDISLLRAVSRAFQNVQHQLFQITAADNRLTRSSPGASSPGLLQPRKCRRVDPITDIAVS